MESNEKDVEMAEAAPVSSSNEVSKLCNEDVAFTRFSLQPLLSFPGSDPNNSPFLTIRDTIMDDKADMICLSIHRLAVQQLQPPPLTRQLLRLLPRST